MAKMSVKRAELFERFEEIFHRQTAIKNQRISVQMVTTIEHEFDARLPALATTRNRFDLFMLASKSEVR